MENLKPSITVSTTVNATVENCWKLWTTPADIMQWNNPFDDWHQPRVEVDLKESGSFFYRMEAKNGSAGFDHSGKYDKIIPNALIGYTVSDGRKSMIVFTKDGNTTNITETFEPEKETPINLQKDFCQAILNNFKKYAETVVGS